MTSRATPATAEVAIRAPWARAAPRRTKNATTENEAAAISTITPSAPMLPPQVNRCSTGWVGSPSGLSSATAKPTTTTAETAVCSSDPVPGAPLEPLVRPKAAGSSPSRPMAKAYRATTLWKLSSAANMPVTNSTCSTSVKVPPSRDSVRKNRSPALCS